jgi:putative oxidoreductase
MQGISRKQQKTQELAHATARVIIASYFMAKSLGLIIDPTGMGQFLAISNVPDYLRWPNAGFEFVAAFAIMLGFQTRMAAALLALYLFWSSFILNYTPGDPYLIGAFWRDLAMIGGLLLLFSHGRGAYALDNWLQKRADRRAQAAEEEKPGAAPQEG